MSMKIVNGKKMTSDYVEWFPGMTLFWHDTNYLDTIIIRSSSATKYYEWSDNTWDVCGEDCAFSRFSNKRDALGSAFDWRVRMLDGSIEQTEQKLATLKQKRQNLIEQYNQMLKELNKTQEGEVEDNHVDENNQW